MFKRPLKSHFTAFKKPFKGVLKAFIKAFHWPLKKPLKDISRPSTNLFHCLLKTIKRLPFVFKPFVSFIKKNILETLKGPCKGLQPGSQICTMESASVMVGFTNLSICLALSAIPVPVTVTNRSLGLAARRWACEPRCNRDGHTWPSTSVATSRASSAKTFVHDREIRVCVCAP